MRPSPTLPILLAALALAAVGARADETRPTYHVPKENAPRLFLRDGTDLRSRKDVVRLAKQLPGSKVSGNDPVVWDLRGGVLRGDLQRGDGGQDEHQEPLFRARLPLVVKNGFVQHNKNAALFYAPRSGLERITFTDIGEDAVATQQGAHGFTLKWCEFINGPKGDKAAQLNEARGAVVAGNLFHGGRTALRVGDDKTTRVEDVAEVRSNHFHECDTAIHASRLTVREWDNRFDKVKTPTKTAHEAVILGGKPTEKR